MDSQAVCKEIICRSNRRSARGKVRNQWLCPPECPCVCRRRAATLDACLAPFDFLLAQFALRVSRGWQLALRARAAGEQDRRIRGGAAWHGRCDISATFTSRKLP